MATSSSAAAQSSAIASASEWRLLSDKSYSRPHPSRSETAPALLTSSPKSRQPRQPSPLRIRTRSAPPPSAPSPRTPPSDKLVRPMIAYLPSTFPAQSLDAAMFHDMGTPYKTKAPHRSSPLSKGVYTIYEAPITPPESPEPSIADALRQEAEERAMTKGKGPALASAPRKHKLFGRATSAVSLPTPTPTCPPRTDIVKSASAPPSIHRRMSSATLAITVTSSHPAAPRKEATWMTEVAAPTFSRYQMTPGIVLPVPATRDRRVSMYQNPNGALSAKIFKAEEGQRDHKPKAHVHVTFVAGLKPVGSLASHLSNLPNLSLPNLPIKKRTSIFFGSKPTKQTVVAAG
ncbi:hypothetical protein DACRYDRAFT_116730 [Dacryopinax primogenitus]|uniref:Uncharacterized protein n=1 Tax=Dacryopinax primogenitus (strain DJM 731) TaxID=1858805 RepID=M5G0I9_DACPD|nr:uncharacterized protein DACRYDRAFT_116730 [Dacryopinax primogenitus]EJU01645.1 hypothetical protein DACRYDRAFT_116730 [Dacryopinax primogenitus]